MPRSVYGPLSRYCLVFENAKHARKRNIRGEGVELHETFGSHTVFKPAKPSFNRVETEGLLLIQFTLHMENPAAGSSNFNFLKIEILAGWNQSSIKM